MWLPGCILQEVGWDTNVGRSTFIKPNSGILIENPLTTEDAQNNLTNCHLLTSLH
jgi:hypothetical protein